MHLPRDEEQGLRYLRAASEKGNGDASHLLFTFEGQMIALPDAMRLLETAAAQGSRDAELTLKRLREMIRGHKPAELVSPLEELLPVRLAPLSPAEMVAAMQRGKTVTQKNCFVCHAGGLAGAPKIDDAARWRELKKPRGWMFW